MSDLPLRDDVPDELDYEPSLGPSNIAVMATGCARRAPGRKPGAHRLKA